MSGPTDDGSGNAEPPTELTGFGYVRNIGAVRGSTHGGNKITVVGDTTVTVYTGDTIQGSGGGNAYELESGVTSFNLTQQEGQSGNTLDLSGYGAAITAQVQTQGGISVYLGAGVDSTGTVQDLSGATALVNNLDVQILKGDTGLTTLDYSGYQDFVPVKIGR